MNRYSKCNFFLSKKFLYICEINVFFEKLQDLGKKTSELTKTNGNQADGINQLHVQLEMKEQILQKNTQVF